jgi:hypothetical protein
LDVFYDEIFPFTNRLLHRLHLPLGHIHAVDVYSTLRTRPRAFFYATRMRLTDFDEIVRMVQAQVCPLLIPC